MVDFVGDELVTPSMHSFSPAVMTTIFDFDILALDFSKDHYNGNRAMSKNPYQKPSPETQEQASKIAKAIQRPAQTKEQTKLIAQGIQEGIERYKKQQKAKARELDKKRKKLVREKEQAAEHDDHDDDSETLIVYRQHWLPWTLLILTWAAMAIYFFMIDR